jgi:hypothetical protein
LNTPEQHTDPRGQRCCNNNVVIIPQVPEQEQSDFAPTQAGIGPANSIPLRLRRL